MSFKTSIKQLLGGSTVFLLIFLWLKWFSWLIDYISTGIEIGGYAHPSTLTFVSSVIATIFFPVWGFFSWKRQRKNKRLKYKELILKTFGGVVIITSVYVLLIILLFSMFAVGGGFGFT